MRAREVEAARFGNLRLIRSAKVEPWDCCARFMLSTRSVICGAQGLHPGFLRLLIAQFGQTWARIVQFVSGEFSMSRTTDSGSVPSRRSPR